MKKLMMAAIGLMMATSVNAQKVLNESTTPFEESKFYVGASLSGLTLNYSKASDWSFGLSAKAGYLFLDNWMALGVVDYQNYSSGTVTSTNIGAGARYYFDQVGIFVGALAKYAHMKAYDTTVNDFQPEIHAGYAFFRGRHVTIEPEAYYKHSFKDSDYSGFGLRVGVGIYF